MKQKLTKEANKMNTTSNQKINQKLNQKMNRTSNQKLNQQFWIALVVFSLVGQIAWVIENMYFNVFIYKMFHASAMDISLMVGASAVVATITTWFIGALSDKIGKRKIFICGGYCIWGVSILAFSLIRLDVLTPVAGNTIAAASLGATLVILMDCVMTFFGSMANDACFNAWLTDMGDESNRGRIEGINAMMPLVAILVVFGGFAAFDLNQASSWTMIYTIIGVGVFVIGVLGIILIEEPAQITDMTGSLIHHMCYGFRPSVIRENPILYMVTGAFAIFGISIQIFMPYLILYYEKTLQIDHYVLVLAPAIMIAAFITALYGQNYDKYGFKLACLPTIVMLMLGYIILYNFKEVPPVFIGSLLMMSGYLTGMAVFGAMIRDHIPNDKAGMFQGLRICGQVLIPGVVGPAIGAGVLKNADVTTNSDGTTSFLPNHNIYLAAFIAALVLLCVLFLIFQMMNRGHRQLSQDSRKIGWKEYPRPQMKRDSFYNLNGEWKLDGEKIIIPYAPQAFLSGYQHRVHTHLLYEKIFELPDHFIRNRVLLHFGAVDQVAEVWLNRKKVGVHEGGYLPFTLDITDVVKSVGDNYLEVKVMDHLSELYPYGKQRKKRGGMWYTPVSGIWQTVWLESVPERYITGLSITPDLTGINLEIQNNLDCSATYQVEIKKDTYFYEHCYVTNENPIRIDIPNPKLWTPETPELYEIKITMITEHEQDMDHVTSYFALRTIEVKKDKNRQCICLNGKPVFLNGVLDQGYYPNGIYLPSTEEAYKNDILSMKQMGFNTLRKHIKVEPECFYYYCDLYGMMVIQDMVNNGHYSFLRDTVMPTFGRKTRNDHHPRKKQEVKDFFIAHTIETIRTLYNHPCIVGDTIFNEGWGQFDSDSMYDMVQELDKSRFIDTTSGWFAQEKSDVESLHIYYETRELPRTERPIIVSECGGYAYKIEEHSFSKYTHYGYGNCSSSQELTKRIEQMYRAMIFPYIDQGLCGCIYTQLSDVEEETNGLLTYDREICKVEPAYLKQLFETELYSHFRS